MSVLIPVVLGTGRLERRSEKIATLAQERLGAFDGVSADLIDVKDHVSSPFTIPAWVEDKNASKWRKIAQEASGFVFVVPEYNRSFPGEFKLLFDSAFKEYMAKPVVIIGVSNGKYGGVRVIQHITPILLAAGMEVLPSSVATSNVSELIRADGSVTEDEYLQFLDTALTKLVNKLIT